MVGVEISTAGALLRDEHHEDTYKGLGTQQVWEHVEAERRSVSMRAVLAGKGRLAAIRWFRSVLCKCIEIHEGVAFVQNGVAVAKQDGPFGDIVVEEVLQEE